ncbi:hypothetical protein H8356DRAFT_1416193 [Neocallimastix lanati (nom. inval.)]|nr:hypothetical protein H8356DRAFT_1416193 [Neocallimastix sp. JGI-2020a]
MGTRPRNNYRYGKTEYININYNYREDYMVHFNNNSIIKPNVKIEIWILGRSRQNKIKIINDVKPNIKEVFTQKLRWYNITLQEKGFHRINDVLDTSNINGVIILNT